jgi:hypothetical protein
MFLNSFRGLKTYCEAQNFAGWDPYDGLNSKVFQATPLKHWDLARLAWIQGFKRSPINFRKLLLVPKEYNAKGIGLFLTGYCNIYKAQQTTGKEEFGTQQEILEKINDLAELLISMQSKGYSGACWGYNFDWQNRVFFQPVGTPTIVATSFCADALFNAFEITGKKNYLEPANSSCEFVCNDLNRTYLSSDKFIFSYSPLDNSKVYNASLLGARLLARGYHYTENQEWKELSLAATSTIINKQSEDGSWIYGEANVQNWIDSFHTGFNLECIFEVMKYTNEYIFNDSFTKGIDYYLTNFFLPNGTPKYYHNQIYPIDIHSPAQLIATLSRTNNFYNHTALIKKILNWTIQNMQSPKGYFYYQLKKGISSKIPYMRWAQAWMFYAFSEYFKSTNYENLD